MTFTQTQSTYRRRSPSSQSAGSRTSHGSSPSSTLASVPKPSPKPPSLYHDYKGDVKAQDLIVEAIEAHRRKGEKHKILFPGSDKFELERLEVWNHDSICTPCLILQPKTTAEVSSCVTGYAAGVQKCLKENRKTGSKLGIPRLTVAGGRGSYVCMMEGAIVLDLGRMKRIKVDVESRTVAVQGGTRIADLDYELGILGLMAVCGTYQNVGVVGCILGGGIGYASRKHGLAADNLLSAKVVLADGRVKTCSPTRNEDLYWSLRGGGGGIGVVTEVTLRCYPLCNAALLTFDLVASSGKVRKNILENWANWICGDVEKDCDVSDTATIDTVGGAPKEVYSQLILPTNSSYIPCISASVDPEVIPQSEGRLEQFQDMVKSKNKKRFSLFGGNYNSDDSCLPTCWARVPGLAELKKNKFGATMRMNSNFQMVRYYDQLQHVSEEYLSPGNVYIAYKYAKALSAHVTEVLVQATTGSNSPNNESRIFITSAGCAINDFPKDHAAFDAREMNFAIYIEGRWSDSFSENRDKRERRRVMKWVHWVSSQLSYCEGIQSTAHPEASRDRVSKSGKTQPPDGYFNFSEENGTRLLEIKRRRDPRNVFSLASRVTWKKSNQSEDRDENAAMTGDGGFGESDNKLIKAGEVDADACHNDGVGVEECPPMSEMSKCDSKLSSDESMDDTDESVASSSRSKGSDDSPCIHHHSKRNLFMGPQPTSIRAMSARSVISDLESINEETPKRSAGLRMSKRNFGSSLRIRNTSTRSAKSPTSDFNTNRVRSMRSAMSDLESIETSADGFPIDDPDLVETGSDGLPIDDPDLSAEHTEESTDSSEEYAEKITDNFNDDASEWSLPVNMTDISNNLDEEDVESILTGNKFSSEGEALDFPEEHDDDFSSDDGEGPGSC